MYKTNNISLNRFKEFVSMTKGKASDFQIFKEGIENNLLDRINSIYKRIGLTFQNQQVWVNLPSEVFEGFEHYQISNFGNVRNSKGQILKPWTNKNGLPYQLVRLSDNHGNKKTFYVHRLVAFSFIKNEYDLLKKHISEIEVNHKDKNPRNNHISNLEFCSCVYNRKHEQNNLDYETRKSKYYDFSSHLKFVVSLFRCGLIKSVKIDDLKVSFKSIKQMCKYLNLDRGTLNKFASINEDIDLKNKTINMKIKLAV